VSAPDASSQDTIAAIATPPGRGAVGILRLSGPQAREIAARLCGKVGAPRRAVLRNFRDAGGERIDNGLVLYFEAPRSYTGEDVVELQGHGGLVVTTLLLEAACAAGARPARPGEFSERAFLNGRLDLAQAEAVADLVEAGSRAAARAAMRSLHGDFSKRVAALLDELIALRADLEAALDFADEEVPWISDDSLHLRVTALVEAAAVLLREAAQGRRLREGMSIAIVGRPNAGKSTLLNLLAGAEAAIVSPHPGTTRDLLREHILVDGLPLTVIDTAGLRETEDVVEQEGVRRAWDVLAKAELVLYVGDDRSGLTPEDQALMARLPEDRAVLLVLNKCDLSGAPPGREEQAGQVRLRLSAATGAGLSLLREEIKRAAGLDDNSENLFTARARHLDALQRAQSSLRLARAHAARRASPELIAEELRQAQLAFDEIGGRFSSEDLLGRIFASFCIGK
jgi:tRNA modification GTPase